MDGGVESLRDNYLPASETRKEGSTRPQKSNLERQVGGRRPLYQGVPWVKSKHLAGVASRPSIQAPSDQ